MPVQIGKHIAYAEENVLFLRLVDELTLEDFKQYTDWADQLAAAHGSIYIVDDLSAFRTLSAEVRHAIAEWFRRTRCAGAAVHGGSLAARAVADRKSVV